MEELYSALIAGGISLVTALIAFAVNWLKSKSIQNDVNSIKNTLNSTDKVYYIYCPNCGSKILLSTATIYVEDKSSESASNE